MMENSAIITLLLNIYKRLKLYYENSLLHRFMKRASGEFRRLAAGSRIIGFFDRDWKVESAWRNSVTFRLLVIPLRLFKGISDRFSNRTNTAAGGSKAIGSVNYFLKSIFNISTRVYGLFFLAFGATQGFLDMILNREIALVGLGSFIRAAFFVAGAVLILVDRPLKVLCEGSFIARLAADFFKVRGFSDGTDGKQ